MTSAPRVDGVAGERQQVVAGLQHDGLDAAAAALIGQVEPLGLPATRFEVHDQHTPPGGGHWRAIGGRPLEGADVTTEGVSGQQPRHHQRHQPPSATDSQDPTTMTANPAAADDREERRRPLGIRLLS